VTLVDGLRSVLPDVAVRDPSEPDSPAWHGATPEFIASPSSTEDVSRLLVWAAQEGLGVLPVASGSHADPVSNGRFVALDTSLLSGIEEYEPADLTITAGAGTRFATVDDALRGNGQWAPFDPPAARGRSMGGLVSEAAHGSLWAGYGALKNHVLGATVVTGDGRVLRLGGKVVKNVAGYDLLRSVVGGRGRLCVLTSVCLRAFPLPPQERVLLMSGTSVAELIESALAVGTAPVLPASIVVAGPLDVLDGRAALVVRLHGAESTVDADQATLETHVGRPFDRVMDVRDGAARILSQLQDLGAAEERCIEISVLPSQLSGLVSCAADVGLGPMVVDSYAGRIRIGGADLGVDPVGTLRAAAEKAGGALRIVRWNGADSPTSTPQSAVTAMLSERLESIFDPGGVLWPARS
jgi:glycolate oxidase FAD binding subunit